MGLLSKSAAEKLQKAQHSLANAEQLIVAMSELRRDALSKDDEAGAAKIDAEMAAEVGKITRLKDQIVLLEQQAIGEKRDRECKEYAAALKQLESSWLPDLKIGLADVERAIVAVATAVEALANLQNAKLKKWPANLPRPLKSQMSTAVVERGLAAAFGIFDSSHAKWRWSLSDRCEHVRDKAMLIVGKQHDLYEEMLEDLCAQAPNAAPATESEAA
jgi:hypothetical protein